MDSEKALATDVPLETFERVGGHRAEIIAVNRLTRLTAQPPDMSVLGVATQFFAEPRLAFTVPPEVFIPPPDAEVQ